MSAANIGKHLVAYLEARWGQTVALESIEQIPGGASRETFRVQLRVADTPRRIILRRDPVTSLIDTERRHEYRTYEAVYCAGFPVPEPLLLEEGDTPLERPFSLMAEVAGCESALASLGQPPFDKFREKIGTRKWTLMGRLASMDIDTLGLRDFMKVPQHAARHELDYWSGVIRTDALHPQPVAEATIRWLQRNLPPASEDLCLVHGDFRTGNFLYNPEGEISAVLDWEMAHIGDPLEDLAWSCDPLWGWPERHLAGGLLPREKAIEIWEAAAGRRVDRRIFRWWQVFASLKGLAIWISSAEDYANGTSKEPILAVAGWLMTDRQNRVLVDRLHPATTHTYTEGLL
ncbi:MAG: phosphotransferase family protein [Pseudomonadales bacterium]|nr:phosphotransferase family protein [Pseudomonadales bacterium]